MARERVAHAGTTWPGILSAAYVLQHAPEEFNPRRTRVGLQVELKPARRARSVLQLKPSERVRGACVGGRGALSCGRAHWSAPSAKRST